MTGNGAGVITDSMCSRRQFLGLYPHQGLIKQSMVCGPRMCRLLASFFSTMHLECPLVQERSEGGSMSPGRERPNPWRNSTFLQTCPLLGERPCGGTNPQGKWESPRKGPTERIQGVSGPAAGDSGTGAPENQWGRVNSNPHVPHWASFCGISRAGVRLRCQQREIGAVVDHLLPIFSGDALGKSKWPIRDGFPGEGGRPTAHHRLKIPQEVLGLFPHTPMR